MAIPGYLHLGFFIEDSVGWFKCPPVTRPGSESLHFERLVEQHLGQLPSKETAIRGLSRDDRGLVTVSLWQIDGEADLAATLLNLQRTSGCEIVERRGKFHTHFVHPTHLESTLRYYVEEYRAIAVAWQQPDPVRDHKKAGEAE